MEEHRYSRDRRQILRRSIDRRENKINVSELLSIIISKTKLIRYYVSARLKLKYIPELRFYYDDSFEYAENIDKLINKIHKND